MAITKASQPNTLSDGTTIFATPLNENFQQNETVVNDVIDIISSPPDGFGWDYQITTGIASSDLTVTLVKKDGTTFTSSNKGYIRIGNTLFDISSALSVTLDNADGDYFGWDTGKIQDNDAQLFVYLASNSGTLRIGLSSDPSKVTCGANRFYSSAQQGSAGHTNGVWSSTVASSDPCRVIGRINVKQTDADAWTSPTTAQTINYPIYHTDWLSWSPPLTTGADVSAIDISKYKYDNKTCHYNVNIENRNVTTAGVVQINIPAPHVSGSIFTPANMVHNGTAWIGSTLANLQAQTIDIRKTAAAGAWAGTETGVYIRLQGHYEIA